MQFRSIRLSMLLLIFLQHQCFAQYNTPPSKKVFQDTEIMTAVSNFCRGNNRNFCSRENLNLALKFVKQNQIKKENELRLEQQRLEQQLLDDQSERERHNQKHQIHAQQKLEQLEELEQKIELDKQLEYENKLSQLDRKTRLKQKIFREFQELFSRTI